MDQTLQFVIPALMGVESTVAYELKKLGLSEVRAENGRVLGRARRYPPAEPEPALRGTGAAVPGLLPGPLL
jgi:23S rRNA G2445 N2-methylase RlmL